MLLVVAFTGCATPSPAPSVVPSTLVDMTDLRGHVAWVSASATQEVTDIMVLTLDGSGALQPARITHHELGQFFGAPSWSPDGKRIAYQHTDPRVATPDRDEVAVYMMNADGSDPHLIVTQAAAPAWSPIGTELAISNVQPSGRGIALVDLTGNQAVRRQITTVSDSVSEEYPAWSPDGLRLAFNSHRAGGSNSDIWAVDRDGANLANLTADSTFLDNSAAWSPDGSRIAFSSNRTGDGDVYLMDPDGSHLVRMTNDPTYEGGPVWSPDGQFIIFSTRRTGGLALWVMRSDGTGEAPLLDTPDDDLMISWAP